MLKLWTFPREVILMLLPVLEVLKVWEDVVRLFKDVIEEDAPGIVTNCPELFTPTA
jgi:hypothetical protein